MRRSLAVVLVIAACGGGAPTLAGVVGPIADELDEIVTRLHNALDIPLGGRSELYQRVAALGVTAVAGDLYDQATRLEEPLLEPDLSRFTGFIGELLLASGDVDVALSGDDLEMLAVAWLQIDAAAGVLAVSVDPEGCPGVVPGLTNDLCRPDGVAAAYDNGVQRAVRLFLARYRPIMRLPAAFGDGVRGEIAMLLAPEVVASIDAAVADLAALAPPDLVHARVHQSFVDHLLALREIWAAVPDTLQIDAGFEVGATPDAGDVLAVDAQIVQESVWPALLAQLQAAACDGVEGFAAARTPLRTSFPGSTLPALGELWFYGEGTGCP